MAVEILCQPLAYMAFRDNQSNSLRPFLIWFGGISLTLLIYLSPFDPVPMHLPPKVTSPLLLLSALVMVWGVLSVMHRMNYPHRPGSVIGSVSPFHSDGLLHAKRVMDGHWPQ